MATAEQTHTAATLTRKLPRPPPEQDDRPSSSEAYRSQAAGYDQRTEQFQHWRELLIDQLPARLGDTVLDIGCGTGPCLPLLHEKVGPTGTIIGIDASGQILKVAADRVTENTPARLDQSHPTAVRTPAASPVSSHPSKGTAA